jgi:hypothetical protein
MRKRKWRFELTLEDGQKLYVGADGNPDSVSMFVGDEDAARIEAARRVLEFEKTTGTTPASVRTVAWGTAQHETETR